MQIVEMQCCVAGCGHSPFPMASQFYERARRTHEFWTCPAGHRQHFTGESEEEERHRKELASKDRIIANWRDRWQESFDLSRTCPWPTCRSFVYSTRDSMYEHMRRAHAMPTVTAVNEEEAS